MKSFFAYTDGSAETRTRSGGWAYKLICGCCDPPKEVIKGGWERETTISRMELTACISALEFIWMGYGPSVILLFSDSEYVVKGFMDPSRNRLRNLDLWSALDAFAGRHELVEMQHVRGHAGDVHNEECDELAGIMRKRGLECLGS